MPARRLTRRQLDALADRVCELVHALTSHRGGTGPHWIMIHDIETALRKHGLDIDHDDLQAAVAIAVERCVLKTEGEPPHSVSPFEVPGKWLEPR
jgi:hypothetical protein